MSAVVHQVGEVVEDPLARAGQLLRPKASLAEQFIHRARRDGGLELAIGSDQLSVLPVCSSSGRGAIKAISMCVSTGNESTSDWRNVRISLTLKPIQITRLKPRSKQLQKNEQLVLVIRKVLQVD